MQHIQGGCTGLCQPVDIGVAKLLKDEVRNQWAWMMEYEATQDRALPRRECIDNGTTPPQKREHIGMWIIAALQRIYTQTVNHPWHFRDLIWLLEDAEET